MAETPKLGLEDLLTRALAKQTPHKARRKPSDSISPKELAEAERRLKLRFLDPANWERTRTVALIHEETETLLGNFAEYKHKLSEGTRKLQRVTEPTAVQAIERVSGAHWVTDYRDKIGAVRDLSAIAEEEREAILDLHLPEMDHVFSPEVMVTVKLIWGGIAEVRLTEETRFFSKDRRVQLILPEGIDVLEGMSLDCKLELRKFLGL